MSRLRFGNLFAYLGKRDALVSAAEAQAGGVAPYTAPTSNPTMHSFRVAGIESRPWVCLGTMFPRIVWNII